MSKSGQAQQIFIHVCQPLKWSKGSVFHNFLLMGSILKFSLNSYTTISLVKRVFALLLAPWLVLGKVHLSGLHMEGHLSKALFAVGDGCFCGIPETCTAAWGSLAAAVIGFSVFSLISSCFPPRADGTRSPPLKEAINWMTTIGKFGIAILILSM